MKLGRMDGGKIAFAICWISLLQVAASAGFSSFRGKLGSRRSPPTIATHEVVRPEQVEKSLVSHKTHAEKRLGLRSSTPEQLEPWIDHGLAVKSSVAVPELRNLGNSITGESFLGELHAIVDPEPSRFIADPGNNAAAANIKRAFDSLGLQTEVQPLVVSPALNQYVAPSHVVGGNVLAYMRGTTAADELIIVAAHYDSVNWKDITKPAPGVDDNASGVALALLLAKALKQLKVQRSILFVIFNAEEEGLVGSKQFAQLFQHGGSGQSRFGRPVAALVADEVAYRGPNKNTQEVIFETKGQASATNTVVDTLAHVARDQCSDNARSCVNGFVVNYHGFGSDHIPLLDVGIPAVLLIERNNMLHADRWGHSEEDTYEHINPGFGAATTRLALQTVATLATPQK